MFAIKSLDKLFEDFSISILEPYKLCRTFFLVLTLFHRRKNTVLGNLFNYCEYDCLEIFASIIVMLYMLYTIFRGLQVLLSPEGDNYFTSFQAWNIITLERKKHLNSGGYTIFFALSGYITTADFKSLIMSLVQPASTIN